MFNKPIEVQFGSTREDLSIYQRDNGVSWKELPSINRNGQVLWYPIGRLLVWLTGIAVAGLLFAIVGLEIFSDGLIQYVKGMIQPVVVQLPLPEQREMLLSFINYLPAFFAVSWIFGMIFNGALAQGLLVRFGQNLRPSPKLAEIELPLAWMGLLAISVFLASFSDGILDVVGKTLAAISFVPYFLLGLGLVHRLVQTWKARLFILFLLYSLMFFWPLPAFITSIGLINSVLRLQRSARSEKGDGDAEREG